MWAFVNSRLKSSCFEHLTAVLCKQFDMDHVDNLSNLCKILHNEAAYVVTVVPLKLQRWI